MAVRKPNSVDRKRYDVAVSRKLKVALFNADMTVKELSDLASIPYDPLLNMINGKCSPSVFNIAKICRVLDLDANEILGIRR